MMRPYSLNIVRGLQTGRANLDRWLNTIRPDYVFVQDELQLAIELRPRFRGVFFRPYAEDDANWYKTRAPRDVWAFGKHITDNGLVFAVMCEPVVATADDARALTSWCTEFMLIRPEGARVCLPNFSVGNPAELFCRGGLFDGILRFLKSGDFLGLHEYGRSRPDDWPWRMGRYQEWLRRARQIGVPAPQIAITEHGFDAGGGHGDGWQRHISAEDYAALLKRYASNYNQDGVGARFVFCYGTGFDWGTFNIEREDRLMDELKTQNDAAEAQVIIPPRPKPDTGGVLSTAAVMPGAFVNVRAAPDTRAQDVGDLAKDARVYVYIDASVTDWVYIEDEKDPPVLKGWVSLQAGRVRFDPVPPSPPPPPPDDEVTVQLPEFVLKRSEARTLAEVFRALATALEVAAAQTALSSHVSVSNASEEVQNGNL